MKTNRYQAILIVIHCLYYLQSYANETLITPSSKPPWKLIVEEFINETSELDSQWEQLTIDKKNLFDEKQRMQTSLLMTDVIRLNIGGEMTMTSRASLTRVRKSVLAIIFNSRWEEKVQTDLDGHLFFDFDSTLFHHLLQQLRTNEQLGSLHLLPPQSASPKMIESYARMLKKLGLPSSPKSSTNSVLTLNVGGQPLLTRRHRLESIKLASLLSQSSAKFIDADPQLFRRFIKHYSRDTIFCSDESTKNSSEKNDKEMDRLLKRFNLFECWTTQPTWMQDAITVAGSDGKGSAPNQLHYPYGIDIDDQGTLFVADYGNDRIVMWKKDAKTGIVVVGGKFLESQLNQLSRPSIVILDRTTNSLIISETGNRRVVRWSMRAGARGEILLSDIHCNGLAMDRERSLYVSDQERHEVRRYRRGQTEGIIVAGGHGAGSALNQLNIPRGIFVDDNRSVYVADTNNHRVMKWIENAKEGIVVAGGQGNGNSSVQLSYPAGLFVNGTETLYVAEAGNNRVTRWFKGSTEGTIVAGGNGRGSKANQFYHAEDLSFDRYGNLYVTDHSNHRIQKFSIK